MTMEEAYRNGRTTAEITAFLAGMIDEPACCENCGEHYPPCDQDQEGIYIFCSWWNTTKPVSYFCKKWETPMNGASKSTPPFWATRDKQRIQPDTSNARCLPVYKNEDKPNLKFYDEIHLSRVRSYLRGSTRAIEDAHNALETHRN